MTIVFFFAHRDEKIRGAAWGHPTRKTKGKTDWDFSVTRFLTDDAREIRGKTTAPFDHVSLSRFPPYFLAKTRERPENVAIENPEFTHEVHPYGYH